MIEDTKVTVSMADLWITEGEMRVMLHDGENGYNQSIILSSARSATAARTKAKRKLRNIIKRLEAMDA